MQVGDRSCCELVLGEGTIAQLPTAFGDNGDPVTRADVDLALPFSDGAPKLNAARNTPIKQRAAANIIRRLKALPRDIMAWGIIPTFY